MRGGIGMGRLRNRLNWWKRLGGGKRRLESRVRVIFLGAVCESRNSVYYMAFKVYGWVGMYGYNRLDALVLFFVFSG